MSDLFAPLFTPARLRVELSARAWAQAMLETEAALAAAEAEAGVIPRGAAEAIADACGAGHDRGADLRAAALGTGAPVVPTSALGADIGSLAAGLGEAALDTGNPVVPLVARLREAAGHDAGRYVHWGATSQDVLDTAAMLVARRALALVVDELDGVARACAGLARAHGTTLMAGRTLLQQALPVTFGLKAAGWLDAALDARAGLRRARLDVQLGGAAGTLAALGAHGPAVAAALARRLGLGAPELPWHTARGRVAELGAALAVAAGAMGKTALDLVLLAQTEVAEIGAGSGGSSTLPHKQNPVGAVRARACAARVPPLAALLLAAMAQEHERAAGAWHAEWEPLCQALALTGGAAAAVRESLELVEVRPERMRANLDATGGVLLSERIVLALAPRAGRAEAVAAVQAAAAAGGSFRDALLAQPAIAGQLDGAALDELLDPAGYLGATGELIARALARCERELGA